MRKGQLPFSFLQTAVIILVVATVFYFLFTKEAPVLHRVEAVNAVQTWVLVQSQVEKVSTARAGTERPPVPDLGNPIAIESEDQLKDEKYAHKQIADAMYDCWTAFDRGNTDFLKAVGKKTFCYPCVAITIDDALKNKGYKLVGLNSYLAQTKVRSGLNVPTYLEYLTNEKEIPPGVKDEFEVNDNLYVFLLANAGRGTWDLLKSFAIGADDASAEDALRAQLATVGAGTGLLYAQRKANAFIELEKLQENPAYKQVKKEGETLQKQVESLEAEVKKLKAEGKDLSEVLRKKDEAIQKLATSQSKVSELESVGLKNVKNIATTTPIAEGSVPQKLLDEYQTTQNQMRRLESQLKNLEGEAARFKPYSVIKVEKAALEKELAVYASRATSLETTIAEASSKVVVKSTEKALTVTSEQVALNVERAVAKGETVAGKVLQAGAECIGAACKAGVAAVEGTAKAGAAVLRVGTKATTKVFAKTAVRFVPLVGQAIFIADLGYTSYKVFWGDRLYSAVVVIDEPKNLEKICNPESTVETQELVS